jgi:hypothetical protein
MSSTSKVGIRRNIGPCIYRISCMAGVGGLWTMCSGSGLSPFASTNAEVCTLPRVKGKWRVPETAPKARPGECYSERGVPLSSQWTKELEKKRHISAIVHAGKLHSFTLSKGNSPIHYTLPLYRILYFSVFGALPLLVFVISLLHYVHCHITQLRPKDLRPQFFMFLILFTL